MNLYFYAVHPPVRILNVTAGLNPKKVELNKCLCTDVIIFYVLWVHYINLGVLPISMRPG
jgi:hypothetical protein